MSLPYPVKTEVEPTFTDERFPGAVFRVLTKADKGCAGEDTYTVRKGEIAHAHSSQRDKDYGLVCIQQGDAPTDNTLAHEYAHLLNSDNADIHGAKWRKIFSDLGYPESAAKYLKKRTSQRRTRVSVVHADGTVRNWGIVPLWAYEHTIADNGRIDSTELLERLEALNTTRPPIVKVFKGKLDEDPEEEYVVITRKMIVTHTVSIKIKKSEYSGNPKDSQYNDRLAMMEDYYPDYEWQDPTVTAG